MEKRINPFTEISTMLLPTSEGPAVVFLSFFRWSLCTGKNDTFGVRKNL